MQDQSYSFASFIKLKPRDFENLSVQFLSDASKDLWDKIQNWAKDDEREYLNQIHGKLNNVLNQKLKGRDK